ncbi:hypothetical protein GGD67_003991 [Bradyrhizobium sp. IAR9]|nr:hypothetical protein [Bradyrhizobium sp. IAR9]
MMTFLVFRHSEHAAKAPGGLKVIPLGAVGSGAPAYLFKVLRQGT